MIKSWLNRFFKTKPSPSLNSISFDTSHYRNGGDINGARIWITPEGDGISLDVFTDPPPFPMPLGSKAEMRDYYDRRFAKHGIHVIEVDVVIIDDVRCIWSLLKIPQKPTGMIYLASITIPFCTYSFVLKLQCKERGTTGGREVALFMRGRIDGSLSLGEDGKVVGDWNPDDHRYDSDFPDHPVSRARREFALIQPTIKIDPRIKAEANFELFTTPTPAETTVDKDGGYSIDYPGPIKRKDEESPTATRGTIISHSSITTIGKAAFRCAYSDYTQTAPPTYQKSINAAAHRTKGNIRYQVPYKLENVEGVECVIDAPKLGLVIRSRIYLVGKRQFQIIYVGPPGTESRKAAIDFLNSFHLLP